MQASEEIEQQPPNIDFLQIDSLVTAAGVDGVREILAAFDRSCQTLFATLAEQLESKAFDNAIQSAHALKGSSANVGALRLSQTAREVEDACRREDSDSASARLSVAIEDFNVVRSAFEKRLNEAG